MKRLMILFILMLRFSAGISQNLDTCITGLANEIAAKVSKKKKIRLALADFVNSEGKPDALCDYIRKDLELKLINADELQIMDRKHLAKLLEENHLRSQGLIDETLVKSAVGFNTIDGLVLADITYIGNVVHVKVTVTDIATSLMYAASSIEIANNALVKNILDPDIKVCPYCGGRGSVEIKKVCDVCHGNGDLVCRDCQGTGRRSGMTIGSYLKCEVCGGKGKLSCNACQGSGKQIFYETCTKCNGKVLPANLQRTVSDHDESGSGLHRKSKREICIACSGKGRIESSRGICGPCGGTGQISVRWTLTTCSYCSGTGSRINYVKCTQCNGTGMVIQ